MLINRFGAGSVFSISRSTLRSWAGRAVGIGVPVLFLVQSTRLLWRVVEFPSLIMQVLIVGITLLIWATFPYLIHDSRAIRPVKFWLAALWLALVTSLAENAIRALRLHFYGPLAVGEDDVLAFLPAEVYWAAPLGNILALGALAIVVSLPAICTPRFQLPHASVVLLVSACWYILVVRIEPTLGTTASLLLAVGLAAATARWLNATSERLDRLVRYSTPVLLLIVAVLAIFWQTRGTRREYQKLAVLPPAPPNAPNVLLIVLDTVRTQSLSLYGYARRTSPELERLAKRGLVFDQATAPSSWTLPTHASIFTGLPPHRHQADARTPLNNALPTLAEVLSGHGYQTSGFVANRAYCGAQTGLARGFSRYDEYVGPWKQLLAGSVLWTTVCDELLPSVRKTAPEVNAEFLEWLDARAPRPFFAFLNYYDAHDPYQVPDPRFDQFGSLSLVDRGRIIRGGSVSTAEELQAALDTYEGAISYLDHHVGDLFNKLDERRALDNTVVIITNDHGESFGEQGFLGHGWGLYRQQIGAPLIILYPPSVPANRRNSAPVNLMDLPATILSFAAPLRHAAMPGTSLARYWDTSSSTLIATNEVVLSELMTVVSMSKEQQCSGPVFSLIAFGKHYIRYHGINREELFDVDGDPLELHDLVRAGTGAAQLPAYRQLLKRMVDSHEPSVDASFDHDRVRETTFAHNEE